MLDLEAAYTTYHAKLRGYVFQRIGDEHIADDILGAVWLEAVRCAPDYEDRGWPVSAWLFRVAQSRVIDTARKGARRPSRVLLETDAAPDTFDALESRLDASGVIAAKWERLTLPQRRVLVLRFWHDLSLGETAERLGVTTGAVKALQHRALEALRP